MSLGERVQYTTFSTAAGVVLVAASSGIADDFAFLVLVQKWWFPGPFDAGGVFPPVLGGTGNGYSRIELNSFA